MRASASGFLPGLLLLVINAYGQDAASIPPGAAAGPAATAFTVTFKVKPGKNAGFEKAIGEMMAGVRTKETGNLYFDLLHAAKDSQTYVIVERYRNAEAAGAHVGSEYVKKLPAALDGLLDGPPEAQELVFVRSK